MSVVTIINHGNYAHVLVLDSWRHFCVKILGLFSIKQSESSKVLINPHLPSGPVHPYQLDESISNFRDVWCTFFIFFFYFEKIFLLANREDPDQTPHSAASDLGLHCLPMSQKWDARLIRGKGSTDNTNSAVSDLTDW